MNFAIYTISKNEAHNVEAFMKAAEGCPVYVLDTGSTDDSSWTTIDTIPTFNAGLYPDRLYPITISPAVNARYFRIRRASGYVAVTEFRISDF